MRATQRSTLSIIGLAALLGGCAVYKTTDEDRFPCVSDADCYSNQPSCQPAWNPNGDPGNFCSACHPTSAATEFALCTADSDCHCPMQCLRGPATTTDHAELRCFHPCSISSNCPATQTCNTKNDGVCVLSP